MSVEDWARQQGEFVTAFLAGESDWPGRDVSCEWVTWAPPGWGHGLLAVVGALVRVRLGRDEGTVVTVREGGKRLVRFQVGPDPVGMPNGAGEGVLYGDPQPGGQLVIQLEQQLIWPTWPPTSG